MEIPLQSLNSVVFTVSFWARVEGGTGTWRAAFCSRHSDITGYVIYASNDNKWEFWTGGSGGAWQIAEGPAVQVGEWTHVAASFQPTGGPDSKGVYTGTKTFYINGQEVLQQTGTTYKMNTVQPVTIGRVNDAATFYFNGSIDDVRIYNRALSEQEIAAIAQ